MEKNEKYEIGKVIDDRYKIIQVIGVGGMAVVLKAEDLVMNRTVAIKVLNEENDGDEQAVRRLKNESKAVAMLSNPNIVSIYDVSMGERMKYIVMEYIEGITLKEYMTRKNKLDPKEAAHFAEQILIALEHAHSKGVIHRDIKPQNVMLLKNGDIKVTDFGIAKIPNAETITMTDKALGTVYYISPEQASGKPTGTFSDIYSVGVMLYEMVTGKLPFDGETPVSVAMMQINSEPVKPTEVDKDIPKGLEQIILKAMSKKPEERFKSAHSMLRAIGIFKKNPSVIFGAEKPQTPGSDSKTLVTEKNGDNRKVKEKDSKTSKKQAKITMFPIILGISIAFILVFLISGILIVNRVLTGFVQDNNESMTVTVPDLLGRDYTVESYDELKNELAENYFHLSKVIVADDVNENYGYGQIYNTSPAPGDTRKIASKDDYCDIIVYVNPTLGNTTLADYTIRKSQDAETDLRNKGFDNVIIEKMEHDTVSRGYVFDTMPKAGSSVTIDDTITLYVSTGKTLVTVDMPRLIGDNRDVAAGKLDALGVDYIAEIVWGSEPAGTVIYQSVAEGKKIVADFTEVKMYVSDGLMVIEPEVSDEPDENLPNDNTEPSVDDNTEPSGEQSSDTSVTEEPSIPADETVEENTEPVFAENTEITQNTDGIQ